ncbi:hypothetical protein LJC54_03050 [Parabacteroides sp. OttesenSCG-928-J18]|nr:hypothetical protein [Parabacteroides sp. OttesenSCG-928-J18]
MVVEITIPQRNISKELMTRFLLKFEYQLSLCFKKILNNSFKMDKRGRSFGEIANDNPENWTDEERESMEELAKYFITLGKVVQPYGIDKDYANNTPETLSKRFYSDYFIMSGILEGFNMQDEISFKELNQAIYNYVPKDFLWDTTAIYQNSIITKMIRFGFIEAIETDNKHMPHFRITEEGASIYKQQVFQSLATSSFFNYQTLLLNKRTVRLSILMLIVTACSIVVAVLSLVL